MQFRFSSLASTPFWLWSKESTRGWGSSSRSTVAAAAATAKTFATSALLMLFRCHCDVIIDASIFLASFSEWSKLVHTRYLLRLATSTLRISFRCHVDAIIVISTLAGRQRLLERAFIYLFYLSKHHSVAQTCETLKLKEECDKNGAKLRHDAKAYSSKIGI